MNTVEERFDALVIGLGKTGMSCVRHLKQQGLHVAVTDTRARPPSLHELQQSYNDVPFIASELDATLCQRADQIIISPGVSTKQVALQAVLEEGKPVYGDIELFCQQARAPIVAITGSNGKSTVTTLLGMMAEKAGKRVAVGGNIGTPALDLLQQPVPEYYVLELSSFQLDTTFSLNAFASVVLNVSSDHMDRYESFNDYSLSKQRIYTGDGVMIINLDDTAVSSMAIPSRRQITFSTRLDHDADFNIVSKDNETWLCCRGEAVLKATELAIKGIHNISNALAAMALAEVMHIPQEAVLSTLRTFTGLPHRCQFVACIDEVEWINDSKATNVGACIAAIEGLDRPGSIILIAGGDSKGADLTPLLPVLKQHVKEVLLIGVDADRFIELFADIVPFKRVNNMVDAVESARQMARPGDTVLLAPACASLDMFDNYQQRGDEFAKAVHSSEAAK